MRWRVDVADNGFGQDAAECVRESAESRIKRPGGIQNQLQGLFNAQHWLHSEYMNPQYGILSIQARLASKRCGPIAIRAFTSPEKACSIVVPVFGQKAFGMELHADDGQLLVADGHDLFACRPAHRPRH